jgi:glycosyltransferase involved in cell wall biosynthesis
LLKTALSSALRQERAGDLFDVEIIVVDDCSPEDMRPIATAFPGVRYLRLPENRGASGARNAESISRVLKNTHLHPPEG